MVVRPISPLFHWNYSDLGINYSGICIRTALYLKPQYFDHIMKGLWCALFLSVIILAFKTFRLIQIGEEFCGSKSETLQDSLRKQSVNYMRNYHRSVKTSIP